jgi:hypothetical protein
LTTDNKKSQNAINVSSKTSPHVEEQLRDYHLLAHHYSMNPSEEITMTKEEAINSPVAEQEQNTENLPTVEEKKEIKTGPLEKGEWVIIEDPYVSQLFYEKKAKIVQLIKGIVDTEGTPVIEPKLDASAREKARYAHQLSIGIREEIRAILFGLTSDQTRRREYGKSVDIKKLTRTETPAVEPRIKKPAPASKQKPVYGEHGDGSQFLNPKEIKSEPRRRRFDRD